MLEMFDFVNQVPYLSEVFQGLIAAHALAIFVVNLTPTPDDDAMVAKAYKYIEMIAGIVHQKNVKS